MTKQELISYLQSKGLKADQAAEAVSMCNEYIDSNSKKIKVKATYQFALLVEDMRESQRLKRAGRDKKEAKIDKTIQTIKDHYSKIK